MKKQVFILLAFALVLPSAIAFECNSLSGGDFQVCDTIQKTNLSSYEKDLLMADIFNKNKTIPNFDFVYVWNTNLQIPNSPDGKTYSSGTIKSAWIKVIALMPSIIEENILYSTKTGKLRTEYNYQYVLPSGTEYKDCKTEYSLTSNNANLAIYLNEAKIGDQKISSFNIYEDYDSLNFRSELNIQVRYKVTHYRYKWVDGSRRCRSYSNEYRTDNLKITDNLNAKPYKNQINSSFKIKEIYRNTTQGILEAENYTHLKLIFNNSYYEDSNYIYSLNYTLPYYVLNLKAEKVENTNFNNINIVQDKNKIYFTVRDSSNCKLELFDHFNSKTKTCDLSFDQFNYSIKTDKINYYENDTIKVYILPEDLSLNITYGNESRIVKNYTEFKAQLYQNKIYARLEDQEVLQLINVNKRENTKILYNLGVLFFFGYIFFKITKAYLPGELK